MNELKITSERNGNTITNETGDNASATLFLRDSTRKPIILFALSFTELNFWIKKLNEALEQFAKNEKNLLQKQRSSKQFPFLFYIIINDKNLRITSIVCGEFRTSAVWCMWQDSRHCSPRQQFEKSDW